MSLSLRESGKLCDLIYLKLITSLLEGTYVHFTLVAMEKPSMKCVPVVKMVGDHWTAAAAAAAAAKLLQSCPTLCDPTAAHQAPLSLGFSRQEHWSRLPFLSPMHESEK